ncbi:type II secretion system protein [Candidatus Parcubacteria bacterium]|nr:type II secretion system protein [Candidatus Parcubacteria bacterium]
MLHKLFFRNEERAFTLVELLVVIAIIGILATIVLVSLNTARIRARDTKRLGDIRQIQLALELFADSHNQVYPSGTGANDLYSLTACGAGTACGLASADACGTKSCMSSVPLDPTGTGVKYWYDFLSATAPTQYHLGADLEETTNSGLNSDRDCQDTVPAGAGFCATGAAAYAVGGAAGGVSVIVDTTGCGGAANRGCYDVTN